MCPVRHVRQVLFVQSAQVRTTRHYLITVGGRRGRHPKIGRELLTVETEDQVLFAIDKIIDWVYRRAWSGRLLSEQLDELHFEKFREEIVSKVPHPEGAAGTDKRCSAAGGIFFYGAVKTDRICIPDVS